MKPKPRRRAVRFEHRHDNDYLPRERRPCAAVRADGAALQGAVRLGARAALLQRARDSGCRAGRGRRVSPHRRSARRCGPAHRHETSTQALPDRDRRRGGRASRRRCVRRTRRDDVRPRCRSGRDRRRPRARSVVRAARRGRAGATRAGGVVGVRVGRARDRRPAGEREGRDDDRRPARRTGRRTRDS
ncbi:Helix-turn-helix protein [Burkholderia cenocepacia PC184]|nr:Helix-turn-helix protein [Burkholderia cenocepacia PC184]